MAPVAEQALRSEGLDVEVVRASAGFVRLQISDANERPNWISPGDRMRELRHTQHGRVLDRDELAADKMLALYGRAEARDFVDVYRLRALYLREQQCELAREKDRGFVASMFAEALRGIERRDRIEFDVDATTFDALNREFSQWQRDLVIVMRLEENHELSGPQPRCRTLRREAASVDDAVVSHDTKLAIRGRHCASVAIADLLDHPPAARYVARLKCAPSEYPSPSLGLQTHRRGRPGPSRPGEARDLPLRP